MRLHQLTMAETLKTAIHYTRESEAAAAYGGFGLDTHHRQGKEYAIRHGFTLIDTLVDVVSGTVPIRHREAGKRLYEYIDGIHKVDAVIFPRLDRATRDDEAIEILQLRNDLRRAGMELHYVDRGKADLSRWGSIVDYIVGIMAAEERAELVRKTSEAKVDRALAGNTLVGSRPPYGYRCISVARTASQKGTQRLEIHPDEALIVQMIFEWYTIGCPMWDVARQRDVRKPLTQIGIARRLTELGIPTRAETHPGYPAKRHLGWDVSVVGAILRNSLYATGVWSYRKHKVTAPKWVDRNIPAKLRPAEQRRHTVDHPEHLHIPVNVPMLLDPAGQRQFAMAQSRLAHPPDRHPNAVYLLKGLCECALCGRNLVGYTDHGTVVYKCSGQHDPTHRRPKCTSSQVSGRVLEATVWDFARQVLLDPMGIAQSVRQIVSTQPPDGKALAQRELATLKQRQTEADQERRIYRQMRGRERITEAEFDEEKHRLDQGDQQRTRRQVEIEQRLAAIAQAKTHIATLHQMAERIQDSIEHATAEQQREYLVQLKLRCHLSHDNTDYVLHISAPWLAHAVEIRVERPIPEEQSRARAQTRARAVLTEAKLLMAQGWTKTKIVAHLGTCLYTLNAYLMRDQYAAIRAELGMT